MRIGIIGAGNMGSAIIRSIIDSKLIGEKDLLVCRKNAGKAIEGLPNLSISADVQHVIDQVDTVILAVKPQQAQSIFNSFKNCFSNKFVISIMAGWTFEKLKDALPDSAHILCTMPNLPMLVKEGITLFSAHNNCTKEEIAFAKTLFQKAGIVIEVEETFFSAANAVSGCGPSFAALFIESLADGAVRYGVPRKHAYDLATQMVIGTAQLLRQKRMHPGELKDAVCSPNGITIAGIQSLEDDRIRASVINAIEDCVLIERELS